MRQAGRVSTRGSEDTQQEDGRTPGELRAVAVSALPAALALVLHWGLILGRRFDGLYGQDAFAYYDYARQIWESAGQWSLPPPFFWPVGYPALVAAVFPLTGFSPLAGQIVASLAGVGVVLLTYLLARDLLVQGGLPAETAHWIGFVASLLTAVSGQLWQWSITVMSDTAALCWATLAAWTLVRYTGKWRRRWLFLSAVALAWAIMSRWVYGLLVVPFGVYWWLAIRGQKVGRFERWKVSRLSETDTSYLRSSLFHLLLAGLAGLLVLVPQIVLSFAFPDPLLKHEWLVTWSPFNALRSQFETVDGYATYPWPVALFYARPAASPRYLFPLFTPFLLLGLVRMLHRQWRQVAALVAGWGIVIYGFLIGIPYQNFRFTLALLPVVAILAAIGCHWIWTRLVSRWRPLLLVYVLVGVCGGLWYSGGVLNEFIDRKEADLAVTRWVEEEVPAGGRVLAFGLTLTLQHYTELDVHELFLLSTEDLAALLADGASTYVIVPVGSVQQQWAGHPPERNYRWLREDRGLTELGGRSSYTLFRVRAGEAAGQEEIP